MICEKCGGTEITTTYHAGSSYWGDPRHCPSGMATRPGAHRQGEHLHRTCKTCRYDWTDDVLQLAMAGEVTPA